MTLTDLPSGHSHRAELFLSLLELPFERINVAIKEGAHKQPEFLKINPFGQLPVIDDNGVIVPDSNAILVYLASKYGDESWLPQEPIEAAKVQRWLSVATGQMVNGPAAARTVNVFGAKIDHERARTIANNIFKIMDVHLEEKEFLVGSHPTIADIANYTYTNLAPEGDISLEPYPNIRAWLGRIEQLPGFIPMIKTPVGLAAL